jgi:hypothetical protein
MTRFKDFGSGSSDTPKDPISFKLFEEEFSCKPAIQGKVLMNLAVNSTSEDAGAAAQTLNDFFGYVLLEESNVRFQELLVDEHRIVTMDTLSDIVAWLIEEYTARPNQQPEV